MTGLDDIKRWVIHDPALPLEHQFFRALCLLGGVLSIFVVVPVNSFQNLNPWVGRCIFLYGLVSLVLAWAAGLGRYLKRTLLLSFVLLLDLLWFPNGGSQGSIGLYFFLPVLFLVLFFEGPFRLWGTGLLILNPIGLLMAERVWPGLAHPFLTPLDRVLDLGTGYLVSLPVSGLILWVILSGFKQRTRELHETLEALQASEERHRLLADNAADAIWTMDLEGRFTYMSQAVERQRGFTPAEAMGQSFAEILTPASQAMALNALGAAAEAVAGGRPVPLFRAELEQYHRDGSTLWVDVSATGMVGKDRQFLGIFGITRDISAKKRAEERLLEAEALTRAVFDSTSDFIWSVDADQFRVLTFNKALADEMLRQFGVRLRVGMPLEEVFPNPETRAFWQGQYAKVLAEGPQAMDFVARTNTHHLLLTWNLLERDGKVFGLSCFGKDITERTRHEEERNRLLAQMQQVAKLESLGSLAGGVAHDMNNVLGAILGLASVHQETSAAGTALRRDLDTIAKACERGGALVKGLLSFAREGLAEERELDLNTVVREEVALLERTTLQKVRLDLLLADRLPPMTGDPAALSHGLMNLCVNAVDAMPEGGTLTLRTLEEPGGIVLLEVADTGPGMAKEILDRALEPFFTTKAQGKGTGLGLPIVFGTVKAHHGTLEILSEPGQGTRVLLRFPACKPEAAGGPEPASSGSLPASPLSVLLVDDDDLILEAVASILEALGHSVTALAGGEAALGVVAAGLRPDAIILDLNMPGLDGAATLPRLRSLDADVPILLATGRPDQAALNLVQRFPGVTLMAKPFSLKELKQALEAVT